MPGGQGIITTSIAVAGIVIAASTRLVSHFGTRAAERETAALMRVVGEAQERFRANGGRGGYATDLQSLQTPCPGDALSALDDASVKDVSSARYKWLVRSRAGSAFAGVDCHGRPTARDFYLAAQPRVNGIDGRQAMAMTSAGRIFVFFDGIPPRESDMEAGGLATPLDRVESFKIP